MEEEVGQHQHPLQLLVAVVLLVEDRLVEVRREVAHRVEAHLQEDRLAEVHLEVAVEGPLGDLLEDLLEEAGLPHRAALLDHPVQLLLDLVILPVREPQALLVRKQTQLALKLARPPQHQAHT